MRDSLGDFFEEKQLGGEWISYIIHIEKSDEKKSYLIFISDSSFSLFDGVISDVAKTLPNAVSRFQKPSIYAGFRRFRNYSHSTGLNWFRLGNIVCPVYRSFDYLIYPYYPAYHPFCYHFVISVDNREGELLRIIALLLYQNTTQFQDAFRKYDYLWETVNSE